MIVGIEGEVVKKEPTLLHIKTYGITRDVHISLNCSSKLEKEKIISLYITQIIKEDSDNLYGFLDLDEKFIFDRVIKINGIGPSTAMAICSTFTPSTFARAVATNDINSIKMVPGIGPKSAKRILVELGDFALDTVITPKNKSFNEALQALESLGLTKKKLRRFYMSVKATILPLLLKRHLKN
jgi:Holliday junction DNA helicase RuvA